MPQVILSVPQEKLSLFEDLLDALGIEEKLSEEPLSAFRNITQSAQNFFGKYFNWEYFQNELEFE